MPEPEFQPDKILATLARHKINFVLIGGLAATVQGSAMITGDADISYERTAENLERLGNALVEMEASLRGIDEDVPFVPDARTLKNGANFTLTTKFGSLDLLAWPDGAGSYTELLANADETEIGGQWVTVASIDDLIKMKGAAGRPKDIEGIEHLRVAKKLQQRDQPR